MRHCSLRCGHQRCCAHAPAGQGASHAPGTSAAGPVCDTHQTPANRQMGTGFRTPRASRRGRARSIPVIAQTALRQTVPSAFPACARQPAGWESALGKCAGRRYLSALAAAPELLTPHPSPSRSIPPFPPPAKQNQQRKQTARFASRITCHSPEGHPSFCQPAHLLPFLASNSTSRPQHLLRLQHCVRYVPGLALLDG